MTYWTCRVRRTRVLDVSAVAAAEDLVVTEVRDGTLNNNTKTLYEDPLVGAIGYADLLSQASDIRQSVADVFENPAHSANALQQIKVQHETFGAAIKQDLHRRHGRRGQAVDQEDR